MSKKPKRYYKWLSNDGPILGKGKYDLTGVPQPRIEGELRMCEHGYHVCIAEQLPFWCGDGLIEVAVDEADIVESDVEKLLVRTWRFVRRFKWTKSDMAEYARWCVDKAKSYAAAAVAFYADANTPANAATNAAAAAVAFYAVARCAAANQPDSVTVAVRVNQLKWIENRIGEILSD